MRTAYRGVLPYILAQAKNGGIYEKDTLLGYLTNLFIIAVIRTVDEYLLRPD